MQAWINRKPKDSNTTNGERYGTQLPDIDNEYAHLPEFLHKMGTAGQGINGLVPLLFTEIEAWSRMTGIKLTGFESQTLHDMSMAYASMANDEEGDCPIQDEEVHEAVSTVHVTSWMAAAANQ